MNGWSITLTHCANELVMLAQSDTADLDLMGELHTLYIK